VEYLGKVLDKSNQLLIEGGVKTLPFLIGIIPFSVKRIIKLRVTRAFGLISQGLNLWMRKMNEYGTQ